MRSNIRFGVAAVLVSLTVGASAPPQNILRNEKLAVLTLRRIAVAQQLVRAMGAIDTNADGIGEYGSFGELSGRQPCRIPMNGEPGAGFPDYHKLNPPLLRPAFGNVNERTVEMNGYLFRMFLPDDARMPLGEDPNGGFNGSQFPSPTDGAVFWCCYAWPVEFGVTGGRAFFINQDRQIYSYDQLGTAVYSGLYWGFTGDEIFQTTADMGSSPCSIRESILGQDGEMWFPFF